MKRCSKCKQSLPLDQFDTACNSKNGYQSRCQSCVKVSNRKYREKHPGYMKKYYKENAKHFKIGVKRYAKKNSKRIKVYNKKYYQDNIDQIKVNMKRYIKKNFKRLKAYHKEYNKKNFKQIKLCMREYCRNNRGKIIASNKKYQAVLIQRYPKWLIPEQKQRIIDIYYNCPKGYVVDHIIPLQGRHISGLHHPDNLQYLTKSENLSKYNNYPEIDDLWITNV